MGKQTQTESISKTYQKHIDNSATERYNIVVNHHGEEKMEITIKANQMASWIEFPIMDSQRLGEHGEIVTDATGATFWTADQEVWHMGVEIVATGTIHAQAVM